MPDKTRSSVFLQILLWGILVVVLLAIGGLFIRSRSSRSHLQEFHPVQPFALTNQTGRTVSMRDLHGYVWLADIIFTRCAGPCPRMTEEMKRLQANFSAAEELRFVTITTDPDHDTPEVLRKYADKFQAEHERWFFLTGSKDAIRGLARESLKLGAEEKNTAEQENANDLFIHTTMFVLVDKAGRVRGYYESLEEGFQEKMKADISSLLKERR